MSLYLEDCIAVKVEGLAPGFTCLTTSKRFDPHKMSWRDAAPRVTELLTEHCQIETPRLVFAGQVHGSHVVQAGDCEEQATHLSNCDGLASGQEGVFLVIRTADCLPVVLVDPETRLFGACHAGWRGSYDNITGTLIETLEAMGADPRRLHGWIGPSICGNCYEVSGELAGDFRKRFGSLGAFSEGRLLDLIRLNQLQAREMGMAEGALENSGYCTCEQGHLFHSHRRQHDLRGHQYTICGFQG